MRHVPHVYVPPPWPSSGPLPVPADTGHHLGRVLRRDDGAAVSYTDGAGVIGHGVYQDGTVERGDERVVDPPAPVEVVVAPPRNVDRVRFIVEKLAELGVARLRWLRTERTEGRVPKPGKAAAWAIGALQQSWGAHLLAVDGPVELHEVDGSSELLVAHPGGGSVADVMGSATPVRIVIGPEGGLSDAEIPSTARRVDLGPRVLRTETAAIVAAALVLERVRSAR